MRRWIDAVVVPFQPVLRAYEGLKDELRELAKGPVTSPPDNRDQCIRVDGESVVVIVGECDEFGYANEATFTSAEARALAARLIDAAEQAEKVESA